MLCCSCRPLDICSSVFKKTPNHTSTSLKDLDHVRLLTASSLIWIYSISFTTSNYQYKLQSQKIQLFNRCFKSKSQIGEVSDKIIKLVTENGLSELDAWNNSTVQLLKVAKLFITLFVIECNLTAVASNKTEANRAVLADLFELFVLYEMIENHSSGFLKVIQLFHFIFNVLIFSN